MEEALSRFETTLRGTLVSFLFNPFDTAPSSNTRNNLKNKRSEHEAEAETFWRGACKDKAAPKLQWKPGTWRYCWWKRWQPRSLEVRSLDRLHSHRFFHCKQLSASGQIIAFAGNQGEGGDPAISLEKSPLHSVTMCDDIEMELHYTGMITSKKCRPCEQALMSWMKGDTLLASSGIFEEHSGSKRSTYFG